MQALHYSNSITSTAISLKACTNSANSNPVLLVLCFAAEWRNRNGGATGRERDLLFPNPAEFKIGCNLETNVPNNSKKIWLFCKTLDILYLRLFFWYLRRVTWVIKIYISLLHVQPHVIMFWIWRWTPFHLWWTAYIHTYKVFFLASSTKQGPLHIARLLSR